MQNAPGKFIVSLDFELMWGVRDLVTKEIYGKNILGVHQALPAILQYFMRYGIRGTFATVGLLFFENKQELVAHLPARKPAYKGSNFSPYGDYISDVVGADAQADPYHFAPGLVKLIRESPGQELGTHTFSHYYCLEEGQSATEFEADLDVALELAQKKGATIASIVFPRNQNSPGYLKILAAKGIIAYRGNEASWIYAAGPWKNEHLLKRVCRLADSYINLTGYHCYTDEYMRDNEIVNLPASRFLRPYSQRLRWLEGLRLRRIKKAMTHAAKNGLLYHLWWHPHNFGIQLAQNLAFLEAILQHYQYLHKKYGFTSYTMSEYAAILLEKK